MSESRPVKQIVIEDLKTLQVIAHPLRSQILEGFCTGPLTVKAVADKLGLAANKLYYHVNLLEEHGLIRVVETRTVGNMIEKLYRTTADRFEILSDLLSFTADGEREQAEQLAVAPLDVTREELLRSMEARRMARAQGMTLAPRQAMITRVKSRLTEARASEFRARLVALLQAFGNADQSCGEDVAEDVTPEASRDADGACCSADEAQETAQQTVSEALEDYTLAVAYYAT